jgi:hypothetical protein
LNPWGSPVGNALTCRAARGCEPACAFPRLTQAADASGPAETSVTAAYKDLDHYVASYGEATEGLFAPGSNPHPTSVAAEVTRVLALPIGQKPRRTIIDFTQSTVERVTAAAEAEAADFLTRMGMGELLEVAKNIRDVVTSEHAAGRAGPCPRRSRR